MEENKEMLELLRSINETNRKQLIYMRIQCAAALIAVLCCAGVFLLVYNFLPQIQQIVSELPGLVEQMEGVLSNLQVVTDKLTAVDFGGMIEGINSLVDAGESGLQMTVDKLDTIDIDTLNKAIENLEAVVEPMAKFFKVFK